MVVMHRLGTVALLTCAIVPGSDNSNEMYTLGVLRHLMVSGKSARQEEPCIGSNHYPRHSPVQ